MGGPPEPQTTANAPRHSRAPKVTICIPTYDGERYIAYALDSIAAQTTDDFEVLVVDDGSTDATVEIVGRYRDRLPLRIERNEKNLGLPANWNRCLELARGEWIKFVFQDDLIAPSCIETLLEAGEAHCDFVVCERDNLFEDVSEERRREYTEYREDLPLLETLSPPYATPRAVTEAILVNGPHNFIGEPVAVMFRKRCSDTFGPFNESLVQLVDIEYWVRLASNVGMAIVPEALATFRVHGRAATVSNAARSEYRMDLLDPLLIYRDFVFSSHYANFREIATAAGVDLQVALQERLEDAITVAELAAASHDERPRYELRRFLHNFPEIERVASLTTRSDVDPS